MASESKRKGQLKKALDAHAQAAKSFRDAGASARDKDVALANSLLVLSQAHSKSALALKRFLKQHPDGKALASAIRGAFSKKEADISDSMFLGKATGTPTSGTTSSNKPGSSAIGGGRGRGGGGTPMKSDDEESKANNPVDDIMELERELQDMDMALELGNSVASLGARNQNRLRYSTTLEDGSFMVVPPGSSGSSYMSSSLWASGMGRPMGGGGHGPAVGGVNITPGTPTSPSTGTPVHPQTNNPRNRVKVRTVLHTSNTAAPVIAPPPQRPAQQPSGLESSWWGNASTTSQVLAGSVMSLSGQQISSSVHAQQQQQQQQQPTNTKQLMRLLDSIKTLSDENAALLREVEDAETARMEAKRAREQMRYFKTEYGQRFAKLREALEKFRKSHPDEAIDEPDPVIGR